MTIKQLSEELNLKALTDIGESEVSSCYISDLLSHVMGKCKEGDVWITVQTSMNMVAVALMTDAACVIFPENITAPENVLEKAKDEGLTLFSSEMTAFELAVKLSGLLGNTQ